MRARTWLLAALLPCVAACIAAGPDYVPPDTTAPDTFEDAAEAGLTPAPARDDWWQELHDDVLTGLVQDARDHNHDVRIALQRLREARALRIPAELDQYPVVTSAAAYSDVHRSDEIPEADGGGLHTQNYQAGFDATWELDFFGHVSRSLEAATADVDASAADLDDVLVTVTAEVARVYVELRGAQQRLAVAHRNADNQARTLQLTEVLLQGGKGTALDTSRARAQLEGTLATIPSLEASVKRSIHRLGVLTGREPAALTGQLAEAGPLPAFPDSLDGGSPRELLLRRPDTRGAERRLAAETARLGIAHADLYPRISLNGSLRLESDDAGNLAGSSALTSALGTFVSWPAFDLGRVRARVEAADARAQQALATYELTMLRALEDIESALADLAAEHRRAGHLRVAADDSERAASLARMRYEDGVESFLSVLDAERTQLEAEDRMVDAETRTLTALIAVYKALGGGQTRSSDSGS
jgi:outer membrane protein, multidrug efflux system